MASDIEDVSSMPRAARDAATEEGEALAKFLEPDAHDVAVRIA